MNIQTLSHFADLAKKKLQIPHVAEEAMVLYYGSLINYSHECAEDYEWTGNRYLKFLAAEYALDLQKDGEVLQLSGNPGSVTDENAVWLTNPGDFTEQLEIDW